MTIQKLHKQLGELIKQGSGRRQVCIDKRTFTHPLEPDGVCFILISSAGMDCHEMLDDDGGMKELADGSIAHRTAFVLRGSDWPIPE